MRVISGEAKGRRLRSPRGPATRPTADRVRQAIFDIIGDCSDARVLDLFAGTGAMGIEALSRGAAEATFVESARAAAAVIEANLQTTGLAERARVRRADAARFVAEAAPAPFDLVFVDPPYERGLAFMARVLTDLAAGAWVSPGGTVVAEAAVGTLELPRPFRETRTRTFGRTQVTVVVAGDQESQESI